MSTSATEEVVHATCVAVAGRGVLFFGPPGSGKSDLALRLIDTPGAGTGTEVLTAQLVADDQVRLVRDGEHLVAQAPAALAGLLEIRGLGIVRLAHRASIRVDLVVRFRLAGEIERMPELADARHTVLGVSIPLIEIDPAAASAPARVRAAVLHLFSQQNG